MVSPKVPSSGHRNVTAAKLKEWEPPPPSIISSYYVLLIVKILLVLIILFSLPKLVTSSTATTMKLSTTKERRGNRMNQQHHIYKRYKYKLRSLRDDCQNNLDQPCALLIPEESLNCVNACISLTCYEQVYDSTTEIMQNDVMTTIIREPLEDGEIDVGRAKEFDQCVMNQLRQEQQQNMMVSQS